MQRLGFLLRHAASDADDLFGMRRLERLELVQAGQGARLGVVADDARVVKDDVGGLLRPGGTPPLRRHNAGHHFTVVDVHLTAESGDVISDR